MQQFSISSRFAHFCPARTSSVVLPECIQLSITNFIARRLCRLFAVFRKCSAFPPQTHSLERGTTTFFFLQNVADISLKCVFFRRCVQKNLTELRQIPGYCRNSIKFPKIFRKNLKLLRKYATEMFLER